MNIRVKLNVNKKGEQRKVVDAELLEQRGTTILVKLPDGNIITRNKKRDLVDA